LLVIIWMSFCGVTMIFGRELLVNFVIKDSKVVVLAVQLMILGGIFQLVDGIQSVSLGILRGISDVNFPTILTLIAYWIVGLPMCYYLGFVLDMKHIGIWIGLTFGLTISAILLTWRFYNKIKRIELF
jgi:multidrug resistance protein, MATE family